MLVLVLVLTENYLAYLESYNGLPAISISWDIYFGVKMSFTPELLDELNVLIKFSRASEMMGIKVHSSADASVIAATERLFAKKLITASDGGYLTALGREAVLHAKKLQAVLTSVA